MVGLVGFVWFGWYGLVWCLVAFGSVGEHIGNIWLVDLVGFVWFGSTGWGEDIGHVCLTWLH